MPTKTALKSLHKAIRNQDLDLVRRMITDDAELVNAPASSPPKKDDGQSPLQIALKCGQFAIADLLIESGADVTFIETSEINEWRMPVLHDAIRATVFGMRSAWATQGRADRFHTGLAVLDKLMLRGSDPNCTDSYGNTSLFRALLDLRQVLTSIPVKDDVSSDRNSEFDEDTSFILGLLVRHGADIHLRTETRPSAAEYSRGTYFERIVREVHSQADRCS